MIAWHSTATGYTASWPSSRCRRRCGRRSGLGDGTIDGTIDSDHDQGMELSEQQFSVVEAKVDDLMRGTKAGTPERVAAQAMCDEWEKAIALPQATWQQRKDRRIAIAATARRLGLIDGEG